MCGHSSRGCWEGTTQSLAISNNGCFHRPAQVPSSADQDQPQGPRLAIFEIGVVAFESLRENAQSLGPDR